MDAIVTNRRPNGVRPTQVRRRSNIEMHASWKWKNLSANALSQSFPVYLKWLCWDFNLHALCEKWLGVPSNPALISLEMGIINSMTKGKAGKLPWSTLNANAHSEWGEMDALAKSRICCPHSGAGAYTKTEDNGELQLHIQKRLQSRRGFSSSETGLVCFRMNSHEVDSQFEKADNSIGLDRSRGTRPTLHSTCLRWQMLQQTGSCLRGRFTWIF